jgi:hypothetical protein
MALFILIHLGDFRVQVIDMDVPDCFHLVDKRHQILRHVGYGGIAERTEARSALLEQGLDPLLWPPFARRADADDGPVIAVDEAMRGDMIVDFKKLKFGRWQPSQGQVNIAGVNLPNGPVAQLDDVAFGMGQNFHLLLCEMGLIVQAISRAVVPEWP